MVWPFRSAVRAPLGAAPFDHDAGREAGGHAEARAQDPDNPRVAMLDEFKGSAGADAHGHQAAHVVVTCIHAPDDGTFVVLQAVEGHPGRVNRRHGGRLDDDRFRLHVICKDYVIYIPTKGLCQT